MSMTPRSGAGGAAEAATGAAGLWLAARRARLDDLSASSSIRPLFANRAEQDLFADFLAPLRSQPLHGAAMLPQGDRFPA